ncbi:MAG: hypothetical protein ACRCXZ_04795, partial [Patescibacteria group bacterium]
MPKISINELRKKRYYRFYESLLALSAILFFTFLIILSILSPSLATLFILCFSFVWLFRVTLICLHTLYGFKQMTRWNEVNWEELLASFQISKKVALQNIEKIKEISQIKEWKQRVQIDHNAFENEKDARFYNPYSITQTPIFAVYNEPVSVLKRSLEAIFNSKYPLDKICVFITQEDRVGEEFNSKFRNEISSFEWINAQNIQETNHDIVFSEDHLTMDYYNPEFDQLTLSDEKLNVIFVQHPDGIIGEMKGKASNESYAGRQISLFLKSKKIDSDLAITTSLDADSSVGKYFFHMLSYKYCVTPDRSQA